MLKQVWLHRIMLSGVIRRDLRTRYAGSALGMIWTILQPLLHFALYFVVFSWIFQVKFTEKASGGDFALYLLAGLLPWLAFQDGVLRAASVIVDYSGLVKGMRFPAVVLVAGSVCASFVNCLIGFIAF
ncbi:MAG: ABC transporter permease, partial [Candidatus Binatia bacterium]